MRATSEASPPPIPPRLSTTADLSHTYQTTFSPLASGGMMPPPKCRLFLWETHQKKLNTNFCLSLRGADNDGLCPFCDAPEDVAHLFLLCPRSQNFWRCIGVDSVNFQSVENLWSSLLPGPPMQTQRIRLTILTALLWNIWKCRNAKTFREETESNATILRRCSDDL